MEPSEVEAVKAVVASVMHHIDRRRWGKLRPLYEDRVRADYTALFGGSIQDLPADDLIAAWRKTLSPLVTQHVLGPIEVEVVGPLATAHSHVRAYHVLSGAPSGAEWLVAGHYVHILGKSDGAWKIREIAIEVFYQTGNRNLLREAAAVSVIER